MHTLVYAMHEFIYTYIKCTLMATGCLRVVFRPFSFVSLPFGSFTFFIFLQVYKHTNIRFYSISITIYYTFLEIISFFYPVFMQTKNMAYKIIIHVHYIYDYYT